MAAEDDTGVLVLPRSAELNTARVVADFAAEGLLAPVLVVPDDVVDDVSVTRGPPEWHPGYHGLALAGGYTVYVPMGIEPRVVVTG